MVNQGRILIVDDLPDVRATIRGIVEDAGYSTSVASSRQEALEILNTETVHVAVLDIRLDESNEDNQDGLDLMYDIADQYPSVAIIMLTGYAKVEMVTAALQPNRDGNSVAFSFLEKSDMVDLPEVIKSAFGTKIKINNALIIDDPKQLIQELAVKIQTPPSGDVAVCVDEIEEVFRKLFLDCEKIEILPSKQGFSEAIIFLVEPWFQERGQGAKSVVKIGDHKDIKAEGMNFQKYVKGVIGGNRTPDAIEIVYTSRVGGIRYTFLGFDHIQDFVSFYEKASLKDVNRTIDNLYEETRFPQHNSAGRYKVNCDLREFYLNHLHLRPDKLSRLAQKYILEEEEILNLSGEGGEDLKNPIPYIQKNSFDMGVFYAIIHGDLTGYNILVDKHLNTWLIDFATTSRGHILQDYASLECFIKFKTIKTDDLPSLFRWERSLFQDNIALSYLSVRQDINKATNTIQRIRFLAEKTNYFERRAYLVSLLFNTIRMATFPELSKNKKTHALFSASLIVDKILASE